MVSNVLTNKAGNEIIAVVVSSMISERRIEVHLIAYSLKDFGAQLLFIKGVTQPLMPVAPMAPEKAILSGKMLIRSHIHQDFAEPAPEHPALP